MQLGIFTVGDVTPDPTTGRTPSEHERIKATVAIAKKAEEVGLDVVAVGQHHNPPFVASAPTTTMAYIGAQTERIVLSTSTTLITAPRVEEAEQFLLVLSRNCIPWSFIGVPAMSVPCGRSAAGLPIGVPPVGPLPNSHVGRLRSWRSNRLRKPTAAPCQRPT